MLLPRRTVDRRPAEPRERSPSSQPVPTQQTIQQAIRQKRWVHCKSRRARRACVVNGNGQCWSRNDAYWALWHTFLQYWRVGYESALPKSCTKLKVKRLNISIFNWLPSYTNSPPLKSAHFYMNSVVSRGTKRASMGQTPHAAIDASYPTIVVVSSNG